MRRILAACLGVALATFAAPALSAQSTSEPNTDRLGSDYAGYGLQAPDPALCRQACDADPNCRAYTYVKPGVQGPHPRCYLKDPAPAPTANACCVSGVKPTPAPSLRQTSTGARPLLPARPGSVLEKALVAPVEPDAIGKGGAVGSLNGVKPENFPKCTPSAVNAITAVTAKLAEWFGAGLSFNSWCGDFQREIAAGVTLANPITPPGQSKPRWLYVGGSGERMAESMICLARDIGVAPGGQITRKASATVAGVDLGIEQNVGLSKFDAAAKRAELWHQTRICAPIVGCFDAERQNIALDVRASVPAWPAGMKVGDYPVLGSYSVGVAADWSGMEFGAKSPPITVVTPYVTASMQPEFAYASTLFPVDTPFDHKGRTQLYFQAPGSNAGAEPNAIDVYGRTTLPQRFTQWTNYKAPPVNPAVDCPGTPKGFVCIPTDPNAPAQAWSSQIGLGARHGVWGAPIWAPAGGAAPVRPDLDANAARSALDLGPTVAFVAKSPVTIKPSVLELLELIPPGPREIIDDIKLEIVITPQFSAGFAAQLGLIEREGKIENCLNVREFGEPCGVAEALMNAQTRAEGRMDLFSNLKFKISFKLPFTPDVDFSDGFVVPLASGTSFAPAAAATKDRYAGFARAAVASASPGAPALQTVKGLSGNSYSNVARWTEQCLRARPPQLSKMPEPTHQPGSADDLAPELLPCNICVAGTFGVPYKPFVFPEVKTKTYKQAWTCDYSEKTGCHDLCTFSKKADGKTTFDVAVRSAVEVVGDRCTLKPPPEIK